MPSRKTYHRAVSMAHLVWLRWTSWSPRWWMRLHSVEDTDGSKRRAMDRSTGGIRDGYRLPAASRLDPDVVRDPVQGPVHVRYAAYQHRTLHGSVVLRLPPPVLSSSRPGTTASSPNRTPAAGQGVEQGSSHIDQYRSHDIGVERRRPPGNWTGRMVFSQYVDSPGGAVDLHRQLASRREFTGSGKDASIMTPRLKR